MNLNDQKSVCVSRFGNYELTGRCLGKGSYAKVYAAIHRSFNLKVALKTTNTTEMKDSYMKKHFKREAALLSRLNHPGIVALFEAFETKNHFCMALEFGGDNLCDYVRAQKRGRLDEVTARFIARQLTSAVAHIHEMGIVHRDIKLENILVNTETKKVKLTDFGLSNSFNKEKLLMTHCGSPEYAAPEIHLGHSYGFEVDIWALGVVLFAMIVGRLPFEVGMKKPVSNQHRRELFLDEMKRGVKTMKHQSFMGSASFLFKDLVSKLLNPARQHRLKIRQMEKHPWIHGAFLEQFDAIDEKWKADVHKRMAKSFDLTIEDVADELSSKPYGQLGGIYNIEKHLHQLSKIALKKAPNCFRIGNVQSTTSATINRPTTSIGNNLVSAPQATSRRPKTAHGKSSRKPFDNKLREETSVIN